MFRKFISLFLTLAMVIALGITLASCTDDGDNNGDSGDNKNTDTKDTYSVTVKDTDGNSVSGVELVIVEVRGDKEIPYPDTKETGADGKAEFKVNKGTWKVKVDDVPTQYILPNSTFEFTEKAVTITISMHPKYTVKVVDQNGDAVVGASVQMCVGGEGGRCVSFRAPTDEDGETSLRIKTDAYEATVTEVPDGYTFTKGVYVEFNGNSDIGYSITLMVTKN